MNLNRRRVPGSSIAVIRISASGKSPAAPVAWVQTRNQWPNQPLLASQNVLYTPPSRPVTNRSM
jgi:hypothetical protein